MINYNQGYMLRITSWENDGDDYRTVEQQGLTLEEVKFYVEVANLFKSCNDWKKPGFGNSDEPDDETVFTAVIEIASKYNLEKLLYSDPNDIYSWIVDKILGSPVQYDWGFYRVFESYKVYYIKDQITLHEIQI